MCVSDSDRRPTVIVYRVFSHNQTWPEPNERFCLNVNASEYRGGAADIWICLWGGGAEFLRLFCHFWDPRWEICHSGGPQMTVSGWFTPPQWEICHSGVPQMTVSGCFTPPQDGKSVILGSPDDSFRVFYPPLMGNLSFWHPQMTVSGCFTPPPDGNFAILGSPDGSFWVVYPPQWEICHSGVPQMTVSGCYTPP